MIQQDDPPKVYKEKVFNDRWKWCRKFFIGYTKTNDSRYCRLNYHIPFWLGSKWNDFLYFICMTTNNGTLKELRILQDERLDTKKLYASKKSRQLLDEEK